MIRVLLLAIALLLPVTAVAQSEALERVTAGLDPIDPPEEADGITPSPEVIAAYNAAQQAHYTYRLLQFSHRLEVFQWQYLSSQIIFYIVILVVAVGLYFSWMQFHAPRDPTADQTTTIEASKTGFKVTSPVLGVIILLLSLAFFYLYLVHVYPISEIG